LIAVLSGNGASQDKAETGDTDEAELRSVSVPTDAAGLLRFLRLRSVAAPPADAIKKRIENLHSGDATERTTASWELIAMGKPAVLLLREAWDGETDGAIRAQIERCLDSIERNESALTMAAVRLLVQHHPPGAAGVLLDCLPVAEDAVVRGQIQEALNAVACDDKGAPVPAIVEALNAKQRSRRRAAITALAQHSLTALPEALRKLVHDPDPAVRAAAALAMAQGNDADGVTALIALIAEPLEADDRARIEDYLLGLAGGMGPSIPFGDDEASRGKARDAWHLWWRKAEGAGLLKELEKVTMTNALVDKVKALIRKLGDENYEARARAEADLVDLGSLIIPLLEPELQSSDAEVRSRIENCLRALAKGGNHTSTRSYSMSSLVRLIALRKPPGAAEAILAYLPTSGEPAPTEELRQALYAVALENGQPRSVIFEALTDKQATRRIAAAQILCAVGRADDLKSVRKLLDDADATVRLHVAVALVEAHDGSGVGVLIEMVAQLPAEQSQLVEEQYLQRLAGASGPKDLPDGPGNRKQRSKAWAEWWQAQKDRVSLADAFPSWRRRQDFASIHAFAHHTLLVQPQNNTVTELGADGKPRWTLKDLSNPRDIQVLAGRHVLVAEQNLVTERSQSGQILWKYEVNEPVCVQRLKNGNTFIVCGDRGGDGRIIEVDRGGKEVLSIAGPVCAARRLADGKIVAFDRRSVIQYDATGKFLKSTPVQCGGAGWNEVLDNGHVFALSPGAGNVIEFDADGTELGRFNYQGAYNAFRLPNGHTLVTHQNGREYLEVDEKWKLVKTTALETPTLKVRQR
jgi:HEAT repeat protein/outer membrane protein assembly factor BamB